MKRIVFVLSVALVLLTACGSTPEPTKPPEPIRAPEPTPEPPTSIVDGWVATVREGKIRGYTSTATPETVARLAAPTPMPATPLPSFVYGTYTTIITKEDVPAGLSSELAAAIPGKYEITYAPDGRMTLVRDGKERARGTFRLKGDQLLFNADDTGSYACQMFARYTWAIDGKNLMLTKLQDGCDGRVVVMADHPLVLERSSGCAYRR